MGKNRSFNRQKTVVIGVIGACHGVGVTHFCIWLANYMANVERRKTALLEWNNHGDFQEIEKICLRKNKQATKFQIFDVDYFKNGQADLVELCIKNNYERVLIDFGTGCKENRTNLLISDEKIIIGSLNEWKLSAFVELLKELPSKEKSWNYLIAFGDEKTRRELAKEWKIPLFRIPLSADAFSLDQRLIVWFDGFLKQKF